MRVRVERLQPAFAILLLLCIAGFVPPAAGAQQPAAADQPSELAYKNVQVLTLGVQCGHCHVTSSSGNWPMEKDDKKAKQSARKMIEMTRAINRENFDGKLEVTCATCHQGRAHPQAIPPIRAMGTRPAGPEPEASEADAAKAAQVLDRYLQQTAASEAAAKLHTRWMKGTVQTEVGRSFPLEAHQKAPDRYAITFTLPRGTETRGFDGNTAWGAQPNNTWEMQGLERDQARRAAEFFPLAGAEKRYPKITPAGDEKLDGRDAQVINARGPGDTRERLYFDAANGLLLRRVVYHRTPLGEFPEQTDYADYKDVDGVQVPFTIRRTEINARWVEKYAEVRHNTAVEDSRFHKPAAKKP